MVQPVLLPPLGKLLFTATRAALVPVVRAASHRNARAQFLSKLSSARKPARYHRIRHQHFRAALPRAMDCMEASCPPRIVAFSNSPGYSFSLVFSTRYER